MDTRTSSRSTTLAFDTPLCITCKEAALDKDGLYCTIFQASVDGTDYCGLWEKVSSPLTYDDQPQPNPQNPRSE